MSSPESKSRFTMPVEMRPPRRWSPREAIAKEFGVTRFAEVDWHPRYNVPPSQVVETIISVDGEKRLGPMPWCDLSLTANEPKLAPINHGPRPCPPRRCSETTSDGIAAWSWRTASTSGGRTTDAGGRRSSSNSGRDVPWGSLASGLSSMARREVALPHVRSQHAHRTSSWRTFTTGCQ
jgi:hypothetical protein